MDGFRPGVAATAASTKIEISVSCRNLADMDVFSKSDPICVLYIKEFGSTSWVEYGRTEIIWNNLNPEWVKKFILMYYFEERQYLKFEVYDVDSDSRDLTKHDFLGYVECTLGELISQGKSDLLLQGVPKLNHGHIIIQAAEEINGGPKEEFMFKFEARQLDKKDWFGKSDPYLAFYRANEDGTYTVVHRTEYIKNTLNPTWKPFSIAAKTLCGGDYNRTIFIRCFDWNISGKEDLIGEFSTNMQEMAVVRHGEPIMFELINPKKKAKKKKYMNSGRVYLTSLSIDKLYSLVEFVQAGTQLNCTIAIDFTASNGCPTQMTSLHYIHSTNPNPYQMALTAVGEVIQDYDSDKLFPVLGFGARLPPDGHVSHEFFVNGQMSPFCEGIAGVLGAYRNCIQNVQLYGPTNFAPCINHVAKFAQAKRNGSEYFILLIITDGIITDMPQTKQAIVAASSLPLSIIIVGVGQADFAAMEELDGDEVRVSYNGRYAERDIVQFVPFRNFIQSSNGRATSTHIAQARLAKEVLAEIPDQFLSYMKKNKITPGSWGASSSGASPTRQPMPVPNVSNSQQVWFTKNNDTAGMQAYACPPPYPGL